MLTKSDVSARLQIAFEHITQPRLSEKMFLALVGVAMLKVKPKTTFEQKHLIPTVKHGYGNVIWVALLFQD